MSSKISRSFFSHVFLHFSTGASVFHESIIPLNNGPSNTSCIVWACKLLLYFSLSSPNNVLAGCPAPIFNASAFT
ncbi:uncharacterized protein METZ01_LOCUS62090 [marine metagenome]|uniref:Uncharacterized protein n=1 Tax=marine metagenome TaxID=408172 RepID=A0A381SZ46_9ZZZZ